MQASATSLEGAPHGCKPVDLCHRPHHPFTAAISVGIDGYAQNRAFTTRQDVADDECAHHPDRRANLAAIETDPAYTSMARPAKPGGAVERVSHLRTVELVLIGQESLAVVRRLDERRRLLLRPASSLPLHWGPGHLPVSHPIL